MKIIISQQGKKLSIIFENDKIVDTSTQLSVNPERSRRIDKYTIDKAEEFLVCVDKLLKKHHTVKISDFRDAKLEFEGRVGMLTERVVRAIMLGLSF